jgi:hypothetical protein
MRSRVRSCAGDPPAALLLLALLCCAVTDVLAVSLAGWLGGKRLLASQVETPRDGQINDASREPAGLLDFLIRPHFDAIRP